MAYKTKEEAIEAWNTWKGRYVAPTPELFRDSNPCNLCATIMEGDKYNQPAEDQLVGSTQMLPNGAFTSPWPLLSPKQEKSVNTEEFSEFSIQEAFALRARWCALFPSVIEYREEVSTLLRQNDRENNHLNQQLQAWNKRLEELGLPAFGNNDLRGINLGGFELAGNAFDGIWLRNVDLRFSELSLTQLDGAILYNANLGASIAIHASFMNAILCQANFCQSFLSQSRFELSDLNSANFNYSICYQAQFDGAILKSVSVHGAMLRNTSFKAVEVEDKGVRKLKASDLTGLSWDDKTEFNDSDLLESGALLDKQLSKYLMSDGENDINWLSRLYSSIQLKPGMFGVGIDIKEMFKKKS